MDPMAKLKLGVIVALESGPEEAIARVNQHGLPTCQVSCWRPEMLTKDMARDLKRISRDNSVEITTIWTGLPGAIWNFVDGPRTIGLVPPETRETRVRILKKGSDFAREAGVESITTHVGFIPENPLDALYPGLVESVKEVAAHCRASGQEFWFESGQETPVTLLRTIEDSGADNLGVNLDPANLILYGKANPVDALDVIGKYVRGVHAKDGLYPTSGRELGRETPLGEGKVNYPVLIPKLKSLGFSGALTIEREISGPQQIEDIERAIRILTPLC
jgi:sugar phosphate isomerase/epimerase